MHKSDLQDQVVLWMCSDGQDSRIATQQVRGGHNAATTPDGKTEAGTPLHASGMSTQPGAGAGSVQPGLT